MNKKYYLRDSEKRLLELIRQQEPAAFGTICEVTGDLLGWRRLQTAGVLRGLLDKGFCVRSRGRLTTAISQEQVDNIENGGIKEFISARFAAETEEENKNVSGGE